MIIKEILLRRSIRKYKTDDIMDENLLEIIKAAQFAPTAKNNKAVEFIIIKDQVIKEKLNDLAGQDFLRQAPVLIMPLINKDKSVWPIYDLAIASGFMMLQAVNLGLATVWKNIRPEIVGQVKDLLSIPENYIFLNILPVGYPDEEAKAHEDGEFFQEKVHWEKY